MQLIGLLEKGCRWLVNVDPKETWQTELLAILAALPGDVYTARNAPGNEISECAERAARRVDED